MHMMLAALLKTPELVIDEDEAKRLSDAAIRVSEFYGKFVIPEETLAWIGLIMAGAGVYGPRIAAVGLRKKEERKNQQPKVITVN